MKRSGLATLRLHGGKAPSWLIARMTELSAALLEAMAESYSPREILSRLSDPFFFQGLSNALGFDWDSSGSTTVTCGVLKEALSRINIGMKAVGGKGKRSKILPEISGLKEKLNLSEEDVSRIKYGSRISAKVDTAAIQAGYPLYHHSVFAEKEGGWVVIQQGMRPQERLARRYHWLSYEVKDFVVEPHKAILGLKHDAVLDMTSKDSEDSRKACVDLAHERTRRLERMFQSVEKKAQPSLDRWLGETGHHRLRSYVTPSRMNWEALEKIYLNPPSSFEGLLAFPGVGPSTVRGLALLAELLFGHEPSWRDPVRYSFAFGGKDGIPFPVDRRAMDEATDVIRSAVESAKLGNRERLDALARLEGFWKKDQS